MCTAKLDLYTKSLVKCFVVWTCLKAIFWLDNIKNVAAYASIVVIYFILCCFMSLLMLTFLKIMLFFVWIVSQFHFSTFNITFLGYLTIVYKNSVYSVISLYAVFCLFLFVFLLYFVFYFQVIEWFYLKAIVTWCFALLYKLFLMTLLNKRNKVLMSLNKYNNKHISIINTIISSKSKYIHINSLKKRNKILKIFNILYYIFLTF